MPSIFLEFTAGGSRFVINAESVSGVAEKPFLSPVPLAPDVVAGVFVMRGKVWTAVDMGVIAGMGSVERSYALMLECADGNLALLAGSVGNTFEADFVGEINSDVPFSTAPESVFGPGKQLVSAPGVMARVKAQISGLGSMPRSDGSGSRHVG